jgi:MoaA/NifB/PqqE/SkfB family radical SAM enzyme
VGLTTNGMLLNEKNINLLIDCGVDILCVSFAGTTQETHNRFRCGTDFATIKNNLKLLNKIMKKKSNSLPDLHMAYLMFQSNFHEMEDLVPLASELEAKQIVVSHLSLVLKASLISECVFNHEDLSGKYADKLESIKETAEKQGILFSCNHPYFNEDSMSCSENTTRACVITAEGDVVPCVFLSPLLQGERSEKQGSGNYYIFMDKTLPISGLSFGNLKNESLTQIWYKKDYSRFRTCFREETPKASLQTPIPLPLSCMYCYKRLLRYQ